VEMKMEDAPDEITPEMIDAGASVLSAALGGVDVLWEPDELAVSVYRAMRALTDTDTKEG